MSDSTLNLVQQHPKFINLELGRIHDALSKLDKPHLKLKNVIHIAGTNGKGSTSAFLRAILSAAGYKAHGFVSPHIQHLNERILLDNKPIDNDILKQNLTKIKSIIDANGIELSFFELLTVTFFDIMAQYATYPSDYIVIETGLGGEYDATNVLPSVLLSIITYISYDHQQFLGDDIVSIATAKAGIIKENCPVICASQDRLVERIIMSHADEKDSELHLAMKDFFYHFNTQDNTWLWHDDEGAVSLPPLSLQGNFQYENAALAVKAARLLPKPISNDSIIKGLISTFWLARMQLLDKNLVHDINKNTDGDRQWKVILDGCHNVSGSRALSVECRKYKQQDYDIYILYSMMNTKNIDDFINPLLPFIDNWITIPIAGEENSADAHDLANIINKYMRNKAQACDCLKDAITKLQSIKLTKPTVLFIAGSLYQAGHILNYEQGSYDGTYFVSDKDENALLKQL